MDLIQSHHGLVYDTPMEKIKTHQNSNMLWLYTIFYILPILMV